MNRLYPDGVRLRLPQPEVLLAWAAAAVGIVGMASALTPELADRLDLVDGVLPPGVPAAARVVALAFGIALIWLSRSLRRRRHRAWQLAVAVVIASAVAHLVKGLDFEEATLSLVLLVALVRYRHRFVAPGDPRSVPPLLGLAAAALAGIALTIGVELRGHELPDRVADLVAAAGLLAGVAALHLWLKPLSHAVAQTVGERKLARELVYAYGRDSLSFFALRDDKTYFFSPSRRAFLAYRVVAGAALVSGDPVGDEHEFDALIAEFRRVVHAQGWRLAIVGASADALGRYRRLGMRSISMGNEAVLRPASFSLEGRSIRKVRQSVTRLKKAGYTFRVIGAEETADRAAIDSVSAEWLGASAERGFSMALDDLYAPGTRLAIASAPDGEIDGFLHLAPSPAGGGWSLSTMRRRRETPNGLTEFLIVETLAWARDREAEEVALNFCALADFIEREHASTIPRRAFRRVLLAADKVFQLERLHSFSRKFHPEWRPRYLCVERITDLPLVGLAYLHAEQLLTPPAPWRRRGRVSH
jgi:lysyl-tRNA synthetase class 2